MEEVELVETFMGIGDLGPHMRVGGRGRITQTPVLLKLLLFKSQYYFKKLVLFFIVSIKKLFGAPYGPIRFAQFVKTMKKKKKRFKKRREKC